MVHTLSKPRAQGKCVRRVYNADAVVARVLAYVGFRDVRSDRPQTCAEEIGVRPGADIEDTLPSVNPRKHVADWRQQCAREAIQPGYLQQSMKVHTNR